MARPRESDRGMVVARERDWIWRIGEVRGAEESPRLSDARRALERACRMDGRVPHRSVASAFSALYSRWGDCALDAISAQGLVAWCSQALDHGYACGTVHLYLAILHRALSICQKLGLIAEVPNFPRVRDSEPRQGFASDAQIRTILSFLRHDTKPLIEFLAITGWRYREALDLRWAEVDRSTCTIRLERSRTKSRQVRALPYAGSDDLVSLIDELADRRLWVQTRTGKEVDYLFVRDHGRKIERVSFDWRRACALAGCPDLLVHDLRRSAVRRFERAGIPRSVAMQITGHTTESIYARYAITADADVRQGLSVASTAWRGGTACGSV